MVPKLRVYLAEDHAMVRAGVKRLITGQADMEVLGEAGSGETVVAEVVRLLPDVVIMDLSIPVLSGTEATREIKRQCRRVKVLGLSMQEDPECIQEFIAAGASGYVLKRSAPDELIAAIRAVHRDEMYIDSRCLAQFLPRHGSRQLGQSEPFPALTERELTVIRFIALGFSNKEIAAKMELSVKTVETYKVRGMDKAQLRGRIDIVQYAGKRGWLLG